MHHGYITSNTHLQMNYPLPRASQECWTKWYNHTITYGALKNKTILWCAQELPCRFKSEQVKDVIGPHHVFILKLNQQFFYAVIDATETIYRLPKKYYTACFPGIQYSQVPKNNRCKVRLTGRRHIELPYIPESFLEQRTSAPPLSRAGPTCFLALARVRTRSGTRARAQSRASLDRSGSSRCVSGCA